MELPKLRGDESAIALAELIREKKIPELDGLEDLIQSQTDAGWWIGAEDRGRAFFELEAAQFERKRATEVKVDWARVLARKEATMFPAAPDPEKPTVTVSGSPYLVWTSVAWFPAEFIELVQSLGYRGNKEDRQFELTLGIYDGYWRDRMAELSARLLDAGFTVECYDPEARERTQERSFEPRVLNWIDFANGMGFIIVTPKERLRTEALRVSSAKKKGKRIFVRPEFADEIADFAEYNDFKLTDPAAKAVAEYRREVTHESLFVED